ncbi:hypothetical protein ATO4_07060 [Aurantimonas sp. 22II-16-19i]|nr:hypothetical protein ATO4_07060 [Aurantimonas sp. 22II-16-19i]
MRKQTRPFAVEIKRNKRSRDPSPFSDLPADVRTTMDTPFKDAEARLTRAVSAEAPATATPRILEDTTPARTPPPEAEAEAEAEVVPRRRGRPPKVRPEPSADQPERTAEEPERAAEQPGEAARHVPVAADDDDARTQDDAVVPARRPRAVAARPAEDDAPAAPDEAAGPGESGPVELAGPAVRALRASRRRAREGNIGERWKRHLPRWKR